MDASGALASAPSSAAPSGSRSPMFPPGADREEWGPRFNCAPSTSAAASQAMPASGRKRKANFSNDETETLVWNVVRHFSALYGSEALRAHPVRRKQLWTQIQSRVNFLGYTERSIDDLKHKWRDLRLDVKKKITSKKHLPMNRAGGPLHKPRLTPLEKMVASTFLQASHDSEPEIILDPGQSWWFSGDRRLGEVAAPAGALRVMPGLGTPPGCGPPPPAPGSVPAGAAWIVEDLWVLLSLRGLCRDDSTQQGCGPIKSESWVRLGQKPTLEISWGRRERLKRFGVGLGLKFGAAPGLAGCHLKAAGERRDGILLPLISSGMVSLVLSRGQREREQLRRHRTAPSSRCEALVLSRRQKKNLPFHFLKGDVFGFFIPQKDTPR